jgi:phosphoglucomutase
VLDLDAVRAAGVRIGADPLGGASVDYWGAIAERHRLDLTVVNPLVDPTWRFMTLDWDGRSDGLLVAVGDGLLGRPQGRVRDRHRQRRRRRPARHRDARRGLMNPNHFLAVAIAYLLSHRPGWAPGTAVGKTLVSSSLIDRVVAALGRQLLEVRSASSGSSRPARRLGGLRGRGVGRGVVPEAGRQRLDHGQGRHPAGLLAARSRP